MKNIGLKMNQKHCLLILTFLLITIGVIIFVLKGKGFQEKEKKKKKPEEKELEKDPPLNLLKGDMFDRIISISFYDNIYVGVDYNNRYYLVDFDNNIIDQSESIIIYHEHGLYYKGESRELRKRGQPLLKESEDNNVVVYKNNEDTFPHYYFEPYELAEYYYKSAESGYNPLIFEFFGDFDSYYIEDLNLFVYYKYNEDKNVTKVSKYDTKTGKLLVTKSFDGEITKIKEPISFSIGNKLKIPAHETIVDKKKRLPFSCNFGECKKAVVDIQTMEKVFLDDESDTPSFIGYYYVEKRNEKYGVVDENNSIIIPFEYDYLDNSYGFEQIVATKGEKKGIIDIDNNVIFKFDNYQQIVIHGDYIAVVLDNSQIKVIRKNKEILNYKVDSSFNNDVDLFFQSRLIYSHDSYEEYLILYISQDMICETCSYMSERRAFLIYENNSLDISTIDNIYYDIYVIIDNFNEDEKYIMINNVVDNPGTNIYDNNLKLLFQYKGKWFRDSVQVNSNYLLLKNNGESPQLYYNIKEKKIDEKEEFERNKKFIYGSNNPLKEKYLVKLNKDNLEVYDLKGNLLKILKDIEKISYIKENYYMVQTFSNKKIILKLEF